MQMYRSAQGGGISVSWKSRSHFADSFGNAGNSRHFQGCQLFFRQPCSHITVQHFVVHTSIIHIDAPKCHLGYAYKWFHSNWIELNTETNLFSVISRRYSRVESGNALILSTFVFILWTTHVTKNMNGVLLSQAPCILWVWRGDLRIGKTLGCYILEQRQAANLRCAERSNRICP